MKIIEAIEGCASPPVDGGLLLPEALRDEAGGGHVRGDAVPSKTVNFRPKALLIGQGESCPRVLEIVEGKVLLSRLMSDGRRQILELLRPGMLLGTPSSGPSSASVEAITAVRVRAYAIRVFEASARLQQAAVSQLGYRMAVMHELALSLGRKTAAERIAAYLLQLARSEARPQPECSRSHGYSERLVLNQTDLSDHLGLSLETVCRQLTALKRAGVITLSRSGGLTFIDQEKLAALAEHHLPPRSYWPNQPKMNVPRSGSKLGCGRQIESAP